MLAQAFLDQAPNRRVNRLDTLQQIAPDKANKTTKQLNSKTFTVLGRANTSMTFIQGPNGLLVIDCFMRADDSAEALQLFFAQHGKQKVAAIIICNSKHTHKGGMDPLIEHVDEKVTLVVAESWLEHQQNLAMSGSADDEFAALFEASAVATAETQVLTLVGLEVDIRANPDRKSKLDLLFHIPSLHINNLALATAKVV